MERRPVSRWRAAVGVALASAALAGFMVDRGGLGEIRTVDLRQTAPCRVDPAGGTVSAPFAMNGVITGGSRRLGARMSVYRPQDLGDPLAWETKKVVVSGTFERTFTLSVALPDPAPASAVCLYSLAA